MPNRDHMKEVYAEIGQKLKNARLKRGLSLEKISNKTRISVQNLDIIENGKCHLISGEFYRRSFIRLYAKALRINEKKLLLVLNNSLKNKSEVDYKKKELIQEKNKITNEKIPATALVFIASIGLVIIFLFNFFNNSTELGDTLVNVEPKKDLQVLKIDEYIESMAISKEANIKKTNLSIDELKNYKIYEDNLFF